MKKIVLASFFMSVMIVGCAKLDIEKSTSLESFYAKTLEKEVTEVSLDSSKISLEKFEYEYEYELQSYSEEEKEKYEKEFGKPLVVSEFSSNKFIDENKNEINVLYNETDKEIASISYVQQIENGSKKVVRDNKGISAEIITNNIDTQRDIVNRVGLSIASNESIDKYFDLISVLSSDSDINIEEVNNILKLEYNVIDKSNLEEGLILHEYENSVKNTFIDIEVKSGLVKNASLRSGVGNELSYAINIYVKDNSKIHVNIIENTSLREDISNDKELFDTLYSE